MYAHISRDRYTHPEKCKLFKIILSGLGSINDAMLHIFNCSITYTRINTNAPTHIYIYKPFLGIPIILRKGKFCVISLDEGMKWVLAYNIPWWIIRTDNKFSHVTLASNLCTPYLLSSPPNDLSEMATHAIF